MKKTKPEFDLSSLHTTERTFGETGLDSRPMFTANGGIRTEDALIHARFLIDCAEAAVAHAADHIEKYDRSLALGAVQLLEMTRALMDGALEGAGVPVADN